VTKCRHHVDFPHRGLSIASDLSGVLDGMGAEVVIEVQITVGALPKAGFEPIAPVPKRRLGIEASIKLRPTVKRT